MITTLKIKRSILNWLELRGYRVLAFPRASDKRLAAGLPDKELYQPFFSPWLSTAANNEFTQWYKKAMSHTLVRLESCWILYSLAKQTLHVSGDFCELGVYSGGSAYFLKEILKKYAPNKFLHLFDTFEGMPDKSSEQDWHQSGDFANTTLKKVTDYLGDTQICQFYPGVVPDTFAKLTADKFSLVHIDLDLYRSIYDAIDFLLPKVAVGGVMVFDDYGFPTCPGARAAIDDYFKATPYVPLVLPTGQALVFKSF